jgi:fatty acid desaturase
MCGARDRSVLGYQLQRVVIHFSGSHYAPMHVVYPTQKLVMNVNRKMIVAMALCCIVPMGFIVVMTSVIGVTFGWASALALGLVAAGVCVVVMVQHMRHDVGDESFRSPDQLEKSH